MENRKVGVGFGVMILRNNKVLLGKRHFDPQKADSELHGEGSWTMPGGKLHFGEQLEEGAQREILEETGIKVERKDLRVISLSSDIVPDAHFITVGFICEKYSGEAGVMEPDEITRWDWFSLEDLPDPLFVPTEKIIKNYLDGSFYKF